MTKYFYDKQTTFLVRRKKSLKLRDVCICCIQELIHPNENTCFWYVIAHSYRGLKNFTEKKRQKKLVKFAFYIKRVAHYDLSPKRGKSCYLIWCINIVFSLITFLRLCLFFFFFFTISQTNAFNDFPNLLSLIFLKFLDSRISWKSLEGFFYSTNSSTSWKFLDLRHMHVIPAE